MQVINATHLSLLSTISGLRCYTVFKTFSEVVVQVDRSMKGSTAAAVGRRSTGVPFSASVRRWWVSVHIKHKTKPSL